MHRVRQWAHTSAHENRFNPWSTHHSKETPWGQSTAVAAATGAPIAIQNAVGGSNPGEPDKEKQKEPLARRFWKTQKTIWLHSWINLLLVFVPVGIALHFAGVNPNVVFAVNAIAIIPLAGLLTFATECVAHRMGPTLSALINVSFGNAVELIIFIALVKNEIRIVQASLIGSILANLLLILGMAFLIGGLEFQEQVYDSTITQMSACLLALAVLSLLIPTAFHASFNDLKLADAAVLKVSRGVSVILLLMYLLYLGFQLKSHAYLYQGTPQEIIDKETAPGFLQRFDSSSSSSTSTTRSSTGSGSGSRRRVSKRLRAKLGRKREPKTEMEIVDEVEAEAESSERPTEAPVEGVTSKYTEKQDYFTEEPERDEALMKPIPESSASGPQPGKPKKPPTASRGLSFRPPPVFRSSTNPHPAVQRGSALRRHRSAPGHDDDERPNRGSMRSNTGAQSSRPPTNNLTQTDSHATTAPTEAEEPELSQTAAILLLLGSTALVAICAEFLVGSIEHLVDNSPLSEAFVGLIILPIVGNAAEHVTAVTVAAKNKLDLALGVSLGSSIQIALFVTPLIVIIGWIMDKSMSLYFNLFEVASLFVSTFIVNFLVLDGRSNYLEGALLCACYIILAVAAYFFPDDQNQSSLTGGPNTN